MLLVASEKDRVMLNHSLKAIKRQTLYIHWARNMKMLTKLLYSMSKSMTSKLLCLNEVHHCKHKTSAK